MPDTTAPDPRKPTGICSAHRDGEDPACAICYPPAPDRVTAYLAEAEQRWDTAEDAVYATLLGRAQALVPLADIPRLIAAVRAGLALHKPGPFIHKVVFCERHQSEVWEEGCPDCEVTRHLHCRECRTRGPEPCPTYAAIARELPGEDGK